MKINSVSNLSLLCARMNNLNTVQSKEKSITQNTELISSQASLAFKAQTLKGCFRRPVIQNEETKIVYNKVAQILKKLPDSAKMSKPILITAGDKNYGFTWDKSSPNKYKLLVKDNIKSVEDWNLPDPTRSVMSCLFDANGMLQVAELTKPLKSDYSQGVFFHKDGNSGKKIRIDDITLRPTASSENIWSIITELSTRNTSGDIDLNVKLKDVMLHDLFLELTQKRTSILA